MHRFSVGLVVCTQVVAEKSADAPGDWATVKLNVGVTRDKLRTLVMQFYADSKVSAPAPSLVYLSLLFLLFYLLIDQSVLIAQSLYLSMYNISAP